MNRLVALVILCSVVFAGCTAKARSEAPGRYTVTTPLRMDTSSIREYVAQIQSVRNIEIRAQEKGYLQSINVDEGHLVKAGQLLFRIVPTMYQAEYLKAQAAMKEAELEMMNAKTLSDKDIVSRSESAIAQAKLDEAKAEMELARLHLSLTEIRAPFDGVIDRIPLKTGSLVEEGALLTTLSDNKHVFAYFNVPEREYLDYRSRGDTSGIHTVSLLLANGTQHKYRGSVETIEGEFNSETGNIAFRARFPNPDMLLKHGETGKVQMQVPLHNAIIIPQKATYELQDKVYVFVVGPDHVVHSKNITIRSKLPDIYVVDGLAETDKIVLEGVQNIRDDDKIDYRVVSPKDVLSGLQLIKP